MLRKRDERGVVASVTLFNLTSDGIVRDIIFHDTKEAREKHILPAYHNKKEWHTAVLMRHFFRHPQSPAEDQNDQVQLLKVEQIIEQMTVWNLHRGGSIYLDLQMSRQQRKVKRSKSAANRSNSTARVLGKRKAPPTPTNADNRPIKRLNDGHADERPSSASTSSSRAMTTANGHISNQDLNDLASLLQCMADEDSAEEEEAEDMVDESSSATELLSNMIVQRTLKRSLQSTDTAAPSVSLCAVSSLSIPTSVRLPYLASLVAERNLDVDNEPLQHSQGANSSGIYRSVPPSQLTTTEMRMLVAAREAQNAALASLYAATVCSISRRTMGSVVAKILQVMEDDVKYTRPDKFARRLNATMAVRLVCGIMCTQSGSAFLPRYMMSLASQLEWLYDGCTQYAMYAQQPLDASPHVLSAAGAIALLKRLRRKLAVRLQLVGVIAQSKHVALTVCYRDRIVKTLFSLLATPVVASGAGLSLFSWILDLIPVVNTSVLHDKQFVSSLFVQFGAGCWTSIDMAFIFCLQQLVAALELPLQLKRRVWSVFPRPLSGAAPILVQRQPEDGEGSAAVDPWALLEHAPQLPSDDVVPSLAHKAPRRSRRVYRCAS